MEQQPSDFNDRWVQHQRRSAKTTQTWACIFCIDRKIFQTADELYEHARSQHSEKIPPEGDEEEIRQFRKKYETESALKRNSKDVFQSKNPSSKEPTLNTPSQPISKRPLSSPGPLPPTRSISELQELHLATPRENEDTAMKDISEENAEEGPRKRAAVGDGISAGSASPYRESESPPPRRSKARPTSLPYGSNSDPNIPGDAFDPRPHVPKKQLWTPDQDSTLSRASFNPSNIASVQAQRSRTQGLQSKNRKPFQLPAQSSTPRQNNTPNPQSTIPPTILGNRTTSHQTSQTLLEDESYDIVMQPETRPISQEQLVAEVKGIYAGLVMVEAKCIEVDNKQATLAQADGAQSKLNNEQWQALIALHRTLLHEHHDFFLASQHPSASPALRRLASKYAMPARMWRHGIHSFLELLRHRLPASLDHMLAFIYLAYTMMALLYETVPAFEDTWIECLGDLGRYRMAIEDDDIRDREVWTGVARHWYSKASDKAPTTGRLYHHLAILARPNALQQLFYYSKSLCVVVPFTSARESILTLFEPVLNADNGQGQYRLPPLDTAFVKAHGLLFTNRNMEKFKPAVEEFTGLLDNQIGRVTRKFMEQGYHIAVANSVAMLGFASKENPLMRAISRDEATSDTHMTGASSNELSLSIISFRNAEYLNNATLEIVLGRIGDPNVLPFIHVTLVFLYRISRHPGAMDLVRAGLPFKLLAIMLNTLLATSGKSSRIESNTFPIPEKDDARPFPEDFAMRGLLWADNYYPETWFTNEKIDEEEKYHELASMTAQRKERILWLAYSIASTGFGLDYDSSKPEFSARVEQAASRSSTFASEFSATSSNTITRKDTWPADEETDNHSDVEDEEEEAENSLKAKVSED